MRYVNINALSGGELVTRSTSSCDTNLEDYLPKINRGLNFHGYPQTIEQVLFDYGGDATRFTVHGYEESGSTTTAFDMMVRNHVDRYHLAMEAFAIAEDARVITAQEAERLRDIYQEKLESHRAYIIEHGDDPLEITNWTWHSR